MLMNKQEIQETFRIFEAANPHPVTELEYTNPFTLLVAVVCSAQATDVSVNKATKTLFPIADTPEKMVAIGEEKLKTYLRSIGLYQTKAKNVIALSHMLIEHHQSQVPNTMEALVSLPGVGRKTANVVLNCAFGKPTMAVDTHVFRVANRTGLAKAKNVNDTEAQLLKRIPRNYLLHAHHWLILHGRYTCKAQKPLCHSCIIFHQCKWPEKQERMQEANAHAERR